VGGVPTQIQASLSLHAMGGAVSTRTHCLVSLGCIIGEMRLKSAESEVLMQEGATCRLSTDTRNLERVVGVVHSDYKAWS
jgi:hypothetical protein